MAQNFTRDAVTATLKDIVAEYGEDYVYPTPIDFFGGSCTYSQPGDGKLVPSCIVGHVIARLAPEVFTTISELEAHDNYQNSASADDILKGDLKWWTEAQEDIDPLTEDSTLISALFSAQHEQDHGKTWGEALDAYLDALK